MNFYKLRILHVNNFFKKEIEDVCCQTFILVRLEYDDDDIPQPAFACSKLRMETCPIYSKLTIKTPERR